MDDFRGPIPYCCLHCLLALLWRLTHRVGMDFSRHPRASEALTPLPVGMSRAARLKVPAIGPTPRLSCPPADPSAALCCGRERKRATAQRRQLPGGGAPSVAPLFSGHRTPPCSRTLALIAIRPHRYCWHFPGVSVQCCGASSPKVPTSRVVPLHSKFGVARLELKAGRGSFHAYRM